jgi:hypothetical protein
MDVLRTIAHELTHQHQHEREDVPQHAGDTGSEWENEANARAGILMRDYGQDHPGLFAHFDELDENWKKWAAGGLAAAAMMGAPSPAQGQSIQQGLGAVQTIGTMANTLKNTNIPAMVKGSVNTELINYMMAHGGNPNAQNQSSLYQWQKRMQQDKAAQQDQAPQDYTQQKADPQLAAQGDMYDQQLQQYNANKAKANESASLNKDVNKLFYRTVTSKEELIECAKISSAALASDRPITHLNRYTVVSSTMLALSNLTENEAPPHITSVKEFIKTLNEFDEFKKLKIKVGSKVAIINYQPQGDSVELWGFINPKTITRIYREPSDQSIKQFEFNNDPDDVWPRSENVEYNGNFLTNSAFFGSRDSAEKALMWALSAKKNNISISNHIKENKFIESASGYIPTKKQAKDPRYSMALTQDIKPGTLGKVANAFMLNTDSQGRPQEANPNGTVKRLKEELEFIKLTESAEAEIDNLTVDQMLDYANRMHVAGFKNHVMIKKHPRWKLTTLPIGVLQLKDPGRKDIDNDHVGTITEIDLETKPIIVGSRGVIIDGNHRARRAFELGIDSLPAFVPKL